MELPSLIIIQPLQYPIQSLIILCNQSLMISLIIPIILSTLTNNHQTETPTTTPKILQSPQFQKNTLPSNTNLNHQLPPIYISPDLLLQKKNTFLYHQSQHYPFQTSSPLDISHHKVQEQPKTISSSETYISPWRILGFIVLVWTAISLLVLPVLCCALKNAVIFEQFQIDGIVYYNQEIRGTDVRLVQNVVVPSVQNNQLVGNYQTKDSLGSQITVQMKPPSEPNSNPNTDAFRSSTESKLSRPPTIVMPNDVLNNEQIKIFRAQSMGGPIKFQIRKSPEQKLNVSQILQQSKSQSVFAQGAPGSCSNRQNFQEIEFGRRKQQFLKKPKLQQGVRQELKQTESANFQTSGNTEQVNHNVQNNQGECKSNVLIEKLELDMIQQFQCVNKVVNENVVVTTMSKEGSNNYMELQENVGVHVFEKDQIQRSKRQQHQEQYQESSSFGHYVSAISKNAKAEELMSQEIFPSSQQEVNYEMEQVGDLDLQSNMDINMEMNMNICNNQRHYRQQSNQQSQKQNQQKQK